MTDKLLDAMLAFLHRPELGSAEAVTVVSGSESVTGLRDDEEILVPDSLGNQVQETVTVLRVREDSITKPSADATITAIATDDEGTATTTSYKVRDVRKDPQQPGMWRMQVARA